MKILKILGVGVLVIVGLVVVVVLLAPQADGPIGVLPGGPLQAGTLQEGVVSDWSFAADVETIELQLDSQDRSRTTWILVHDGKAYIPCSLGFPPGKTWYEEARQRGDARVRIDGRIYPVRLQKIDDESIVGQLESVVAAKYGGGPPSDAGVWFFELTNAG